jgi:NADH-quinone oxidoreductase subunit H
LIRRDQNPDSSPLRGSGFPIPAKLAADHPILLNLFYVGVMITKTVIWFFMVAMAKAIVPRYRYDQLMRLGWKVFLPMSLVCVILVAAWRVFGPGGA